MEQPKSNLDFASTKDVSSQQEPSDSLNRTRILAKLRDTIVQIATSDRNKHLSAHQISLIEQRLNQIFPVIRTPTHPTYAFMIYNAITELNEEHGSSEKSISEYIKANFDDLPWAHERYLSHHLGKLCDTGEIVVSSSQCYSIPRLVPKKRRVKGKRGRKRKEMMSNGEVNSGEFGTIEVNAIEMSCSREEDHGGSSRVKHRRRSLVLCPAEEEIEVLQGQAEVGNGFEGCKEVGDSVAGLDVAGQGGEIVAAKKLEECHGEKVEASPSEECQKLAIQGSIFLVDGQSMDSLGQIVPLKAMDEPIEEQLPTENLLGAAEPPNEVRTKMLQLHADNFFPEDRLTIVSYESAKPLGVVKRNTRKIRPIVDTTVVCGLSTKMHEQFRHSGKKSPRKRKQKCTVSSLWASHNSTTRIKLQQHGQDLGIPTSRCLDIEVPFTHLAKVSK